MKLGDIQDDGNRANALGQGNGLAAGLTGDCTKGHERKCRNADSDPSECRCSCGGDNHGKGLEGQAELTEIDGIAHPLCEHAFEDRDPNHEDYSMTEVDLFSPFWGEKYIGREGVALSIRKNHEKDRYEIFDYTVDNPTHENYSDEAVYDSRRTIKGLIRRVNQILGREAFEYSHDSIDCPDDAVGPTR